ncbi:signal recognition particle-docking protein FtsY [Psychromonas sp. RZ22]|uniref:signal recognition particle-docking protein FtsY n=1 Tax=Psychromonas algarum TaxID=2555643 RepID=UPI001067890C|nr:signal recognition particle-docking protein FtsY [Psychromonas sp. RZ22]TEW53755.1 signal recognition particle-docking protein FtsY [Psychromonas sp. RZ22]
MSKKKGMFSWFSRKSVEKTEQQDKDTLQESLTNESDVDKSNQQAELAAAEVARQAEILAKEEAKLAAAEVARQAEILAKEEAKLAAAEAARQAEILAQKEAELAAAEAARQAEILAQKEAELAAAEAARQAEVLAQKETELAAAEAAKQAEILAQEQDASTRNESELVDEENAKQPKQKEKKLGFFARFALGLKKTRLNIGSGLLSLFKGKKIDDDLFEELEEQLIVADIGVETTLRIIENLTDHANRKQLKDAEVLYELLKKDLSDILQKVEKPLVIDEDKKPYVILMVGVNGVGKTTTIGKLAKKYQSEGKSVMLAAGDTFRAAAVEQLQVWGERNDIPVIAQQTGADSASVLFDAMDAAHARGADVLIADTAGRLQNKDHLMDELAKVVRIMRKKDATAPHEIMLTIDAGTGQNAISQVKLFHEAVGLTGVTFTKLDGTAKGGIIFSIADQFKLPIRYIGVGEGIDDLREFNAKEFIDALFSKEDDSEQGGKIQ